MPASSLEIGPQPKMISYSKIFNSPNVRVRGSPLPHKNVVEREYYSALLEN
jgi:hypothetical protein